MAAAFGPLLLLVLAVTVMDVTTTPTSFRFFLSGHFLLNAIPAVLLFAVGFALTRVASFAAIAAGSVCGLFYLVNNLKYLYWNEYLFPADFQLLVLIDNLVLTAVGLLDMRLTLLFAGLGVGTAIAFVICVRSGRRIEFSLAARAATLLIVAASSLTLYIGRSEAEPVLKSLRITQSIWRVEDQLRYGLFNHLYLTSALTGLNPEMFEGRASTIVDYSRRQPTKAQSGSETPSDVVVLLAESLFDPETLRTELRADPLAGLRAGEAKNRAAGLVRVHSAGGGTWISEHTFLTGIPGPAFGPSGRWPFYLADENTWTVARAFGAQGYKTYALYPVSGNFIFNVRATYPSLGFDTFIDIDEIRARYGKADGTIDGQIFNAIERILLDEPGPVFIFAVSMDLHHSYDRITGTTQFLSETIELPKLDEYFRRQSVFSAKVAGFLDRRDQQKKHLLFALFGDHVPPLGSEMKIIGFREDVQDPLYSTPYLLHSTFRELDVDLPYLDLSYFAGLVIDQARIDGGEYFQVNSIVRDFCRGQFENCEAEADLMRSYHAYLGENIAVAADSETDPRLSGK